MWNAHGKKSTDVQPFVTISKSVSPEFTYSTSWVVNTSSS